MLILVKIPTNGTNELPYGTFTMPGVSQAISNAFPNPYSDDLSSLTSGGSGFYQQQQSFNVQLPLNYHFYAPIGPHKEDLTAYQRSIHDLFLPDRLREELQRKSEASLQVMPSKFKDCDGEYDTNLIRCYPSEYSRLVPFISRSRYISNQECCCFRISKLGI